MRETIDRANKRDRDSIGDVVDGVEEIVDVTMGLMVGDKTDSVAIVIVIDTETRVVFDMSGKLFLKQRSETYSSCAGLLEGTEIAQRGKSRTARHNRRGDIQTQICRIKIHNA